jgi:hypothetical protein
MPPIATSWSLAGGAWSAGSSPASMNTTSIAPGFYPLAVSASNAAGSFDEEVFLRVANPSLWGPPGWQALAGNTVGFSVESYGARELRWHWGDGTASDWLSHCAGGTAPQHTYSAPGTYQVTVEARGCPASVVSSVPAIVQAGAGPFAVTAFYALGCSNGACTFPPGEPVTFNLMVTGGSPTSYAYDWDGDGSDDQQSALPITQHVYSEPGVFKPRVTATLGITPSSVTQLLPISITTWPLDTIFVDGFESGLLTNWAASAP